MKRILLVLFVLLISIGFAAAATSVTSENDNLPSSAADLSVTWTVSSKDIEDNSGYKFGFTMDQKVDEGFTYDESIDPFPGALTLSTKLGTSAGKYYGEGTIKVYWQFRTTKAVKLVIYTSGEMTGTGTVTEEIGWTIKNEKELADETIIDGTDQTTNVITSILANKVLSDTRSKMDLTIVTDETEIQENAKYSGTIYLKAIAG